MTRRPLLALLPALVALLAGLPIGGAVAQTPDPEGPVLVYQNVHDGDVLDDLPIVLQLCFADPVNNKDLDKGGDFRFEVKQPDGLGLGHRDIFQPDGYGVAVQPGNPVGDNAAGEWTFSYRVTTPDAQHALEATIHYTIDPSGEPAPRVSPLACVEAGGTATAAPDVTEPPLGTIAVTGSAAPSLTATPALASGTPTPVITRGPVDEEGGDDPDIVKIALITLGVVGGLAVLTLIGFFVRRGVGFDWHKPGSGGGDGHH